MTLALDTNVLIDLIRGRNPVVRRNFEVAVLAGESLVTSIVVFHELQFGVAASRKPTKEAAAVSEVLRGIDVEPLNEQDALYAAGVRAELKRQGRPIGPYDGLIAGQALARGWTLVTSNVREFERVKGLAVRDWLEAPEGFRF
ncbi:MAG: type II toxin-antitoxin system VapC family toxin [Caulobacter sp.]|nr:type II toxin-antitoxin system VapC family toxin [Caulobacter sp.]